MRIQILDDHPLYADALRQTVLRLGQHVLVDITSSVQSALEYVDAGYQFSACRGWMGCATCAY